ncbi:hypothetical protein B0T24DRAFT_325183 [Lasiosphaeria ovina]|uniref:Secreted protein n=1 Tax=Lasiosphaeria ovina TaxID=92902 RepID=A0AAE0K8W0_9PEZI|nr:hypothetical protein B0T24DRAFT_325183 [Lasiosphaeria ovina]
MVGAECVSAAMYFGLLSLFLFPFRASPAKAGRIGRVGAKGGRLMCMAFGRAVRYRLDAAAKEGKKSWCGMWIAQRGTGLAPRLAVGAAVSGISRRNGCDSKEDRSLEMLTTARAVLMAKHRI